MSIYIDGDYMHDDHLDPGDKAQQVRAEGPQPGQRWRHYKGEKCHILRRSVRERDQAQLVTYETVDDGEMWTRKLSDFLGTVDTPEGPVARFTPMDEPEEAL